MGVSYMGLDNGIILKVKNKIKEEDIPDYVKIEYDEINQSYDICYWRKCWGLRNHIYDAIEGKDDVFDYELFSYNLDDIIDILVMYLQDGELWDEYGESIWTFKEIIPYLAQNIVNLSWLKKYIKTHVMDKIIFYDSY